MQEILDKDIFIQTKYKEINKALGIRNWNEP